MRHALAMLPIQWWGNCMETCAGFWSFLSSLQLGNVQWLEWAKAAFDLFKGVAWPVAAGWIVWLFRKQIRERIPHVIEVGPTRAVFQQLPTQPVEGHTLPGAPERLRTVIELEKDVRARLQIVAVEHRENELIRAVAEFRLVADFERIFANMFNSQLDFLRTLSHSPSHLAESEKHFKEAVIPIFPDFFEGWGYENWREYLLSQELARIVDDQIAITDKGIDFLIWVDFHKQGFKLRN